MNIYQTHQDYREPIVNPIDQPKLFDPKEAITLGNFFKESYMSWNGFSNYCIQSHNQRQQALLEVQMYDFIVLELNLYLDLHPTNTRMLNLYRDYVRKAQNAKTTYEQQFGPLFAQDSENQNSFSWIDSPWPWEYQS